MAEYITRMSAVAVVKRYEFEKCPEYMQDWATKLKRAILDDLTEDLMNLPAADVAPVVHGRWENNDDYDASVCSSCQTMWNNLYNDTYRFSFCPNCGARMDGEG